MTKKFFKCAVCGDIHHGNIAPDICPTCASKDIYLPITATEAKKVMNFLNSKKPAKKVKKKKKAKRTRIITKMRH